MRRYRIAISAKAAAAVRDIHPDLRRSIRHTIEAFASDPARGAELRRELAGLRRFRVRRFRIVYEVDSSARIVRVLAIGHRRSIYEEIADVRKRK
jgi:mRNA interferase RelE/StbE